MAEFCNEIEVREDGGNYRASFWDGDKLLFEMVCPRNVAIQAAMMVMADPSEEGFEASNVIPIERAGVGH